MYHNTSCCHTLYPHFLNYNLHQKMVNQMKVVRIIYMIFSKCLLLRILAFLVFLTVSSSPLTQGICLGLHRFLFPYTEAWMFPPGSKLGGHRAYLVGFLPLRDHHPSSPNAKCLDNYRFMCLCLAFWLFQEEG